MHLKVRAIRGPLGITGVGGSMLECGLFGGLDEYFGQVLGDRPFDPLAIANQFSLGAITAGIFHGLGKVAGKFGGKIKSWLGDSISRINKTLQSGLNKLRNIADNFRSAFEPKFAFEGGGYVHGNRTPHNTRIKQTEVQRNYNKVMEDAKNSIKRASSEGGSKPAGRLNMAGKTHPVSGVKFDNNGFPIFKSEYNMNLDHVDYLKSRGTHFDRASKSLYNQIQNNPELASKFTQKEIEIFKEGGVHKRFTWHHNQEPGLMQFIHRKTGHDGGFSIWGPGNK